MIGKQHVRVLCQSIIQQIYMLRESFNSPGKHARSTKKEQYGIDQELINRIFFKSDVDKGS